MVRDVRLKEYFFSVGSLTADGNGLFNVYSDHVINGTVQDVLLYSNTYTTTGSIMVFSSGLANSGTAIGDILTCIRAGSFNIRHYPVAYPHVNNSVVLSGTTVAMAVRPTINSTLRVVGSAIAANTSGLGLSVRYI